MSAGFGEDWFSVQASTDCRSICQHLVRNRTHMCNILWLLCQAPTPGEVICYVEHSHVHWSAKVSWSEESNHRGRLVENRACLRSLPANFCSVVSVFAIKGRPFSVPCLHALFNFIGILLDNN